MGTPSWRAALTPAMPSENSVATWTTSGRKRDRSSTTSRRRGKAHWTSGYRKNGTLGERWTSGRSPPGGGGEGGEKTPPWGPPAARASGGRGRGTPTPLTLGPDTSEKSA